MRLAASWELHAAIRSWLPMKESADIHKPAVANTYREFKALLIFALPEANIRCLVYHAIDLYT